MSVAYERLGDRKHATLLLDELKARQPLPTSALIRCYAATGAHSQALELLERLVAEHSQAVVSVLADPALDPLRSNPRFQEIQRRARTEDRPAAGVG